MLRAFYPFAEVPAIQDLKFLFLNEYHQKIARDRHKKTIKYERLVPHAIVMLRADSKYLWTDERSFVRLTMRKHGSEKNKANGIEISKYADTSTAIIRKYTLFLDNTKALVNHAGVFPLNNVVWFEPKRTYNIEDDTP